MQVYRVMKNMDGNGDSPDWRHQFTFAEKQDAMDWCETQPDPWGHAREWEDQGGGYLRYGNMSVQEIDVIENLDDMPEVIARRDVKQLAATARAKLSPEELDALLALNGA